MKPAVTVLLLFFVTFGNPIFGQSPKIDRVAFFTDTSILNITLVTDMNRIIHEHNQNGKTINGRLMTTLADSTRVDDVVHLEKRGHFRSDNCYVPPIRLIFNVNEGSVFYSLKTLKLINECKLSNTYEQYLLKEYTAYKIYNLLTDMSFRVRLLNVTFKDSAGKKKPINEYGFLLEDIKELAKRNNCVEWKKGKRNSEETQRRQMTLVAIFEYMIGNTDWAVSVTHNMKLIIPANDSVKRPFSVPYDFDYSGLVNTDYAVPDERLEIENVKQRLYRGYPRTVSELEDVLGIFKQQKDKIYAVINNFNLLTTASKNEMIYYLDDFYKLINRPNEVKSVFIDNALNQ